MIFLKFIIYIFIFLINFSIYSIQFNLITTFYNEKNLQRKDEYKRCILENIKNKFIKRIYLFYEKPNKIEDFLIHEKVEIIKVNRRPKFQQYFNFANQKLKNELVILSNTDIFFDNTLGLLENKSLKGCVLSLTRYNLPEYKGIWKRHNLSFDSWIFMSPIKIRTATIVGTFGSDLLLNIDLIKSGLIVINPSLSIKTWHVHMDDKRNYIKRGNVNRHSWRQIIHLNKIIPHTNLDKVLF